MRTIKALLRSHRLPSSVSTEKAAEEPPNVATPGLGRAERIRIGVSLTVLGAVLLWAYGPTWRELSHRWITDPRYSHGYLVPIFAVVLLWLRQDRLGALPPRPTWSGLSLIALGGALNVLGAIIYFDYLSALSLLPCLAGFSVLLAGWRSLRWSGVAILFLIFMLPLPYRVEITLSFPLQLLATKVSTYALQTLGVAAVAEGNVILVGDYRIGVVDACNGLGMMVIFFAIATALVLVIKRPWLDKVVVLFSAIPVALIANVARITLTGVLQATMGSRVATAVYHDLAGWLMMPLALGLLWYELTFLKRALVEFDPDARRPLGLSPDRRPAGSRPRS